MIQVSICIVTLMCLYIIPHKVGRIKNFSYSKKEFRLVLRNVYINMNIDQF